MAISSEACCCCKAYCRKCDRFVGFLCLTVRQLADTSDRCNCSAAGEKIPGFHSAASVASEQNLIDYKICSALQEGVSAIVDNTNDLCL